MFLSNRLMARPESKSTRAPLVFLMLVVVSSCSVINEGINTITGSQPSEKSASKKTNNDQDEAQYAKEESDDAEQVIPMDETPKVVQQVALISFNGRDPMAKVKINSEIRNLYNKIAQLVKVKKYQQAVEQLSNVKNRYPQLSGPDYQLARIYYQQGSFDKAIKAVDASVSKNQRNYYSINFKGVVLRAQGKFEMAKQSYLQAIKIYPPYPNAHLNLGVLADIYLGDLQLALLQYRTYMQLSKNKDKQVANWVIELERRIKAGS